MQDEEQSVSLIGHEGSSENETELAELMKKKLPLYIVNCLQAAGYDVPEVIVDMDITQEPGNSIKQIEEFIEKRYPDNPEYYGYEPSAASNRLPFEFPPGHRVRICKFVEDVRTRLRQKRRSPASEKSKQKTCKRLKLTMQDENEGGSDTDLDQVSVYSITQGIRSSVRTWLKVQKEVRLRNFSENKDFVIQVARVVKSNQSFSVHIRCLGCNSSISLQRNKFDSYKISNWTRHVKKCKTKPPNKQSTLHRFASLTPNDLSDSRSSSFHCESSLATSPDPPSSSDTQLSVSQESAEKQLLATSPDREHPLSLPSAENQLLQIDNTNLPQDNEVGEIQSVFQPAPPSV